MTRLPTIPRSQSGNSRTHCTDGTEHFTNDCTFTINIHESLHDFKNKLMGFDKMERRSGIQIESIEKIGDEETIVKWVVEGTKSCEFYLRLKIIPPTQPASPDSPIKITIESTEILTNHSFKSPSTSNRTVLAKIRDGLITLTPSPYSTTTFTFTFSLSVSSKTLKAKQLPTALSSLFYDSFKNEDLIDSRMKIAFVKGISSAKKLSSKEDSMIKSNIERIKELSKAKRIPGTVNDTVEKYLHHDSAKGGAAWGMTIARIDCSGETLMSEVLMLDTFAKKRGGRGERKIWRELDGSRSMQFSCTVKLPGGFKERLIELWVTWDVLTDPQGRKTYVTANSPMLEYSGPTHHKFPNSEKMVLADCRGFDIIKPLSENTCMWTRVQQVDLKILGLPKSFFDIVARHELGYSNEVQEKYRRNEAVVDRERLDALAEKMRLRRNQPLLPDQKPVFDRCMELFGDGAKDKSSYGWKSLESNSKDVEMSLFFPPKEGERTIVTGKAIGVVDCSAEEAAAWVMDYCSNERMGIHREQGHPARVKVRGEDFDRENEATYATVKQHPYPLNSREVVARLIWKSEEERVWVPFDARPRTVKVDYGVKLKQVRGYSKGMWLLENIPSKGAAQCRVTLVQLLDAGGWVPAFVVNAQTKRSVLKPVQQIIARFRQDELVDSFRMEERAKEMRRIWADEVYTAGELSLIERMKEKFEFENNKPWKQLKSSDTFMKMEWINEEGSSSVVGRASTTVDATIFECSSWELDKMARHYMKSDYDEGSCIGRSIVKLNGHCDLSYYAIELGRGFSPREWLTKRVWKFVNKNVLFVGYEDVHDERFPIGGTNKNCVRGSSFAFLKYEKLPEVDDIPQTKVIYCQQADLKGSIPKFVMNNKMQCTLEYLSTMRKKFDQSMDVDARHRSEVVRKIKDKMYSKKELGEEVVKKFEELFDMKCGDRPSRSLGMTDKLVHADIMGNHAQGKATVKVQAELEEVAAFIWNFTSRANFEISCDVERSIQKDNDDSKSKSDFFKKVVVRCEKVEGAHVRHRNRLFKSEMTLHKINEDTIIILLSPSGKEKEGGGGGKRRKTSIWSRRTFTASDAECSRATEHVAIKLKRSAGEKTHLDFACSLNIGSIVANVSRNVTLAFIERRVEEIADASIYFQRLVPLQSYHLEDGQALGYDMLWKVSTPKKRVERCLELFTKSRALRELALKHPCIKALLTTAVEGSLHMHHEIHTKLECLTEAEARQIGKNLVPALMTEQLAQAGIYEWKATNRAVRDLMAEYDWFEPMAVVIGKGIVKTAAWGLMARVFLGALLSMSDLTTDLLVLREFWEGGEEMRAYRNLAAGSLIISVFLQFLLALVQNRKRPIGSILKELFIAAVGLKPPWDAFRVASGYEQHNKALLDPITELTMGKGIEMFTESIPSILIQLSAIVSKIENGTEVNLTSIISLAISLMTTGFVSATLSYDMDTDPRRRSFNPEFYGYVPDSGKKRALLLFALMNLSACQVLLKSMLVVALGQISMSYGLIYIFADMTVYLTQKVLRRDYTFWIPVTGVMGVLVSFLFRIIAKLIADFTGCVHFRHPYEVGGLYFSLNFLSPLMGMTVLLVLQDAGDFGFKAFEKDTTLTYMKTATIIAGSVLILMAGLFFLMMNKSYRPTYFSTETGWQMTRRMFMEGNDAMKAEVFETNILHWEPIRVHVEDWVRNGWHEWKDHRPNWFTDHWITLVPLEMIPKEEAIDIDTDGNVGRGGKRRQLPATAVGEMLFKVGQGGSKKRHSIVVMPVNDDGEW